ncbi:bile acid:sodium symporter family protein [Ornithinibacter aureus]|uniref:Bile acid:sodium symporter family protein n=1 Tax=Ornithinibacter aureus TaxID=622664 RepID=A0ABP8JSV9_9MICO|nr:bile acid:sodium symporter family protein [Ornithinibacter aureus]KAF0833370.1 BASS family bile acid:Na+ symporter [Ornithinibacter aureus]
MDSALVSVGLPAALAVIMFGLGLSLTPDDFARVARHPRAVPVILATQILVLPLLGFAIAEVAGLAPELAVGLLLLAASPGGTTANLFSHLFRGDGALNITLTAVNSVVALVTLPVVVNLAISRYLGDSSGVGMQLGKTVQVFAIVLVPVAIGMLVRSRSPQFADAADRPVRIASAVLLFLVVVGAIASEDNAGKYFAQVGLVMTIFCALSLTVGYVLPRLLGLTPAQCVASGFEIGIHNSTLAIAVALTVLGNTTIGIPAAVYGIVMFPVAALFGLALRRSGVLARTDAGSRGEPALPDR